MRVPTKPTKFVSLVGGLGFAAVLTIVVAGAYIGVGGQPSTFELWQLTLVPPALIGGLIGAVVHRYRDSSADAFGRTLAVGAIGCACIGAFLGFFGSLPSMGVGAVAVMIFSFFVAGGVGMVLGLVVAPIAALNAHLLRKETQDSTDRVLISSGACSGAAAFIVAFAASSPAFAAIGAVLAAVAVGTGVLRMRRRRAWLGRIAAGGLGDLRVVPRYAGMAPLPHLLTSSAAPNAVLVRVHTPGAGYRAGADIVEPLALVHVAEMREMSDASERETGKSTANEVGA